MYIEGIRVAFIQNGSSVSILYAGIPMPGQIQPNKTKIFVVSE